MKWLAAVLLTVWAGAAQAQSGYTDSMWCMAWAPQTWDATNGYKACRGARSRAKGELVKVNPPARIIHGPIAVAPETLAFHCAGKSMIACATRLRPGHCSIYYNRNITGALLADALAEERLHCAGYSHPGQGRIRYGYNGG